MHSRCSARLNPSSVNPAFHLAQGDLSAYGSLMISISCAVANVASHTRTHARVVLWAADCSLNDTSSGHFWLVPEDENSGFLSESTDLNSYKNSCRLCFLEASQTQACWDCLCSQIIQYSPYWIFPQISGLTWTSVFGWIFTSNNTFVIVQRATLGLALRLWMVFFWLLFFLQSHWQTKRLCVAI